MLAGRIKHEILAKEVENAESEKLRELKILESMRPKRSTKFIEDDPSTLGSGVILPGTIGAMKTFGSFIVRLSLPMPG